MYFMGLDLGQAHDPSALCIAQLASRSAKQEALYHGRYLERLPLGRPYPQIVEHVKDIYDKLAAKELQERRQAAAERVQQVKVFETGRDYAQAAALAPAPQVFLIVDATGVGRPVLDMFRVAGLKPIGVTITGGQSLSRDENGFRVPKRELVAVLQALLQTERLKFAARLPEVPTLIRELLNFKVKLTDAGHDTYGAWREGEHDDLVLAAAIMAWYAERFGSRQRAIQVKAGVRAPERLTPAPR